MLIPYLEQSLALAQFVQRRTELALQRSDLCIRRSRTTAGRYIGIVGAIRRHESQAGLRIGTGLPIGGLPLRLFGRGRRSHLIQLGQLRNTQDRTEMQRVHIAAE